MTHLQYLEQHLKFTPGQGKNRKAHCPRPELHAHGDRNPSLSVDVEQGLLKCFVCGLEGNVYQVAQTLGWPSPNGNGNGTKPHSQRNAPDKFKGQQILTTYTYTNEHGRPLYMVCRTEKKEFPVWAPVIGNGSWGLKGKGIPSVPYHLHKLVKADSVFLVEGERDVRTVEEMGLAATTIPGGAGKWRPEYSKWFQGKEIIILPDNDPPGQEHARSVAAGLFAHARSVRILKLPNLPEKGDVSDWADLLQGKDPVDAGEELCKLANAAPRWRPARKSLALSEVSAEPLSFLWHPYLLRRKVNLIEGDPGLGKSYLTLALAAALSRGKGLPGSEPFAPQRTLIINAEDGVRDTIRPRLDSMEANLDLISAWAAESEEQLQYWKPLTLDEAGFEELDREMRELVPALVVLDPLFAFMGERRDINAANHTRAVMARLGKLAEKHNSAIVAIRHLTKGVRGKSIYRGVGSIDLTAAARSVLMVGADPNNEGPITKSVLLHIKHNLTSKGPSLGFEIRQGAFYWIGESHLTAEEILAPELSGEESSAVDEAVEFLSDLLSTGPVESKKVKSAAKKAGISERTLWRAKEKLRVNSAKLGTVGRGFFWSLSPDSHKVGIHESK